MKCLYCKKLRYMNKDYRNIITMEVITKNPNEYNYKQSKVVCCCIMGQWKFWPSLVHGFWVYPTYVTWQKFTCDIWKVGAKTISYLGDNITHQIYGQGNVSIQLNSSQNIKDITNVLHISRILIYFWFAKQLDQVGRETKLKHYNSFLKILKEILL